MGGGPPQSSPGYQVKLLSRDRTPEPRLPLNCINRSFTTRPQEPKTTGPWIEGRGSGAGLCQGSAFLEVEGWKKLVELLLAATAIAQLEQKLNRLKEGERVE